MIDRRFDEESGIIYVTASGEWTTDSLDDHFLKMAEMIGALRKAGQRVRVLVDVRAAPPPSSAVKDQLKQATERTYLPGDRVVLVTPDPEMKDDVRRFLIKGGIWSYCSELAAEQWLFLDDLDLSGS